MGHRATRLVNRPASAKYPLDGVRYLIVDGSNQRGHWLEPVLEETVTAGLRALVPAGIEVHVVFDTDPPVGSGTLRASGGVTIHHARAAGADDVIARLAVHAADRTLVVTNDAELRRRVMELGARAVRNEWLRERRERGRPVASSIGRRQAAPLDPGGESPDQGVDGPGWQPGRGSTTKRGNPRRKPKRR
jgi:hypothetical protein